jgi:hypothetical protein
VRAVYIGTEIGYKNGHHYSAKGIMEKWNTGILDLKNGFCPSEPITPALHHSTMIAFGRVRSAGF